MPLQTIELNPGPAPRATVVVLHGLGADGTDFLPMADEMRLAPVGPVRWVFPRAPVQPVTINGGHEMRAWYDILGTDLARREDTAGLRASMTAVHALLDQEVQRGVPAHRIVLAGFSQGCAITLGAGLRYHQRLAGLSICDRSEAGRSQNEGAGQRRSCRAASAFDGHILAYRRRCRVAEFARTKVAHD